MQYITHPTMDLPLEMDTIFIFETNATKIIAVMLNSQPPTIALVIPTALVRTA